MMHNLFRTTAGLLLLAVLTAGLQAQSPPPAVSQQERLRHLSETLQNRDRAGRQAAVAYAKRVGLPLRRTLSNGRILELQRLTEDGRPVFYISNNVDAADTVSTDEVWPGGSAGLDLDGSGMSVAQWDGGAVYSAHPDLAGRVTHMDGASEISGHSTHVAGTLIGAGNWLLPEARGMAFAAELDAYDWLSDTAEMATAAASGQLLSNHSYGIAAGWIYTGIATPPDTWLWIGGADPSVQEDPNFGYYDTESRLWDQIALDAPYYLIVKAAGNDRADFGAAPGEEYTIIDQDGQFVEYSTASRPADCAPAGYDCLPTHSVAKNILTVGAVDDLLGGYSPIAGASAVLMSDFSSWGPTDDGRIKPDLVGNGVFLYSTWPDNPYYALAAGTSMSAPNVTGSLLLLQQHYQDLHGDGNFLRAATLKALAIHTADEAGDSAGPDYEFGWGLLNTRSAAEAISQDGAEYRIIEDTLLNGETDDHVINVADGASILTATLVWADPPGTPVTPTLDPPQLMLVNDLDLRIVRGGTTYLPWVLNPADPAAAATRGDNYRDNVEQVQVDGGGAGNYTVRVSHKNSLADLSAQDYALIISTRSPPPVGSGLLIDEDFAGGLPAGWSVQTTRGVPWTIIDPDPGDWDRQNHSGGSGRFAIVDNNYVNSLTSLRTPLLDLSANNAVVLRFASCFFFDFFETINVDVSTDAGSNWSNVWSLMGALACPSYVTLDLTGNLAGEANAMLRFRWDSANGPQGNFWQLDNVQVEAFGGGTSSGDPPGPASGPDPANGADGQSVDPVLSWSAGAQADSHDVYFGTGNPLTGADFSGNQGTESFAPGPLEYTTTYYWRIDEVNADGTTTGPTWSFTTVAAPLDLPGAASSPTPANGTVDVATDAILSWTSGSNADSHDVYFGSSPAPGPAEFRGNQAATTFGPGALANATTYYWRIDEVNADGTTTGPTWSFTTVAAPLESIHLAGLAGAALPEARGRWTAAVTVSAADLGSFPEAGVTVDGAWSDGTNGTGSCVTAADGSCTIEKPNLKGNLASVMFTVSSLSKTGFTYTAAENTAPDSVLVGPGVGDRTPSAADDSFATAVDTPLSDNIMANDDLGDAPTSIESHTEPANGGLVLNPDDGGFTYTPDVGYAGPDSFTYRLVDQDGDLSNFATVAITVAAAPPPGARSVTATPFKDKGIQHVLLSWENFAGDKVEIYRDGDLAGGAPTDNDGDYDDDIGVKGGGQTYSYQVCEQPISNCVTATAAF